MQVERIAHTATLKGNALQDEDAEVGAEDVTLAARSLGFDILHRDRSFAGPSSRRYSSDDDAASGGTEGEEADIVRDVGGAPPTTKKTR